MAVSAVTKTSRATSSSPRLRYTNKVIFVPSSPKTMQNGESNFNYKSPTRPMSVSPPARPTPSPTGSVVGVPRVSVDPPNAKALPRPPHHWMTGMQVKEQQQCKAMSAGLLSHLALSGIVVA